MAGKTLITQIQRFAVNDGPGFRTNVFLKGCNLRCLWCHNPETQSFTNELYWKSRLCVQCGACLEACPKGAINPPIPAEESRREGSTYYKIIHEFCDRCMKCVDACRYGALEIVGQSMTVEEVLAEVEQDGLFYNNSGGGMTISGGEPLAHMTFADSLLDCAKKRGIHVCLDTSGSGEWKDLERLAEKTDIVLFDLKHLDNTVHKRITGIDNAVILENLRKLLANGSDVWLRVLVIPGLNDSIGYHRNVVEFLKTLHRPLARIDLLPFHNWCEDKYRWLGREWPMKKYSALDPSELMIIQEIYEDGDLNATIGGSGFENTGKAIEG